MSLTLVRLGVTAGGNVRRSPGIGGCALYIRALSRAIGVSCALTETITKPTIKNEVKPERPKLYKAILLNDDYTPRDSSSVC